MNSIVYVGMDVHKESYTLCCYCYDTDKVEYKQTIPSDYKLILKYIESMRKVYGEDATFVCGYEAGCLGYSLYHQLICNYTDRGRKLIHRKICKLEYIFEYLSENPLPDESAEFNDNVISKISAQRGRCSVSKKQLTIEDITPYRIKKDGGDGYRNIIVISKDIYGLIMEKDISNIQKMVQKLESDRLWNKKVRDKTNKYRELVGNAII